AVATSLPLTAQWLNHPDPRTPRTSDGRPDLTAPAPRMNGKADLSGVWQAEPTPVSEFTRVLGVDRATVQVDLSDITKDVINVLWGVKPEDEPLRPEGASILKQRERTPADRPLTHCLPIGIPAVMFTFAFKIIQAPQEIMMLSETGDPSRQLYIGGRSIQDAQAASCLGSSADNWYSADVLV